MKKKGGRWFSLFFLSLTCSVSAFAQWQVTRDNPQVAFHEVLPPGNYSGITHLYDDCYAMVSDKSSTDGFYLIRMKLDTLTAEILQVENLGFRGDRMKHADCEAIAYCQDTQTLFISREANNTVAEYTLDGRCTGRQLQIPRIYREQVGRNLGLESLAYSADRQLFWIINEGPLRCDSAYGQPLLRLQSFGLDMLPREQYAYAMDPPTVHGSAAHYAHGVSELAALDNGGLLVLEREFYVPKTKIGARVICKIYEVNPQQSSPVMPDAPLVPISKRLVHQFTTTLTLFSRQMANYEGMCFAPSLSDGSKPLIMVCDSQNRYARVLKDWMKTLVLKP